MKQLPLLLLVGALTGFLSVQAQKFDNRYLIKNNGKYGYIDKKGKIAIPFIYDSAGAFSEGLAPVRKGNYYSFINPNGDVILEGDFSYADVFKDGIAKVYISDKPYFIDKAGNILFEHDFIEISDYYGEAAVVIKRHMETRWGLINKSGDIILPLDYEKIEPLSDNGIFQLFEQRKQRNEFAIANHQGEIIVPKNRYLHITPFHNGYASVLSKNKDTKWLIDTQGKELFILDNDHIEFESPVNDGIILGKDGCEIYYYDLSGKNILTMPYCGDATSFSNKRAIIESGNGQYSLINTEGKLLSRKIIEDYREPLFVDGKAFVEISYNSYWENRWAAIRKNGTIAWRFDKSVDEIVKVLDKNLLVIDSDDHCNRKYVLTNKRGKAISNECFDSAELFHKEDGVVKISNAYEKAYKLLNSKGKVIWDQKEDEGIRKLNIDYKYLKAFRLTGKANPSEKKSNVPEILLMNEYDTLITFTEAILVQKIKIQNNSKEALFFDTYDNIPENMRLQAKNKDGEWTYITSTPIFYCDFGAGPIQLLPDEAYELSMVLFEGDIKTKLRIRSSVWTKGRRINVFSKEFDGYINAGQYWRPLNANFTKF